MIFTLEISVRSLGIDSCLFQTNKELPTCTGNSVYRTLSSLSAEQDCQDLWIRKQKDYEAYSYSTFYVSYNDKF